MDKIDLVLTVMISGFTLIFGLLLIVWNNLSNRCDKIEKRMDFFEEKTEFNFKEIRKDMKAFEEKTEFNFKEVRKDMKAFEEKTESNFREVRKDIVELEKKIIPIETILREREYCHFKDESRLKKVE